MAYKTNIGLVEYCKAQLGLPYWWGTFGQIANETLLRQKRVQYPSQYTAKDFETQFGKRVHDCVGLIKGYLWCETPTSYPTYVATQDKDVKGMYATCTQSGLIRTMPDTLGILVFKTAHVGIYIGNGEVIEAKGHDYGVVKTKLAGGGWTKWGKCGYIDYLSDMTYETAKRVVQDKTGLSDGTIEFLDCYRFNQDLFIKLARAIVDKTDS